MIIGTLRNEENHEILLWRAFHEFSGYDCTRCQLKCCYGPYNLPLVDDSRIIELKSQFNLFSASCLNEAGIPSKHVRAYYHREVGCLFLEKDGKCAIHNETLCSDRNKPLKPLVCQIFPLILRKTTWNDNQLLRFIYVHPCGSGTGFQWISKNPITNNSIVEIARKAEPFYNQCFCDQVDLQDSHQDVDFSALEQYIWIQRYMSTLNDPILDELHSLSEFSPKFLNNLTSEIQDFLARWNNYTVISRSSPSKDITTDVLTKRELGTFNPFIIWITYNSRLMEIPEPTMRWKVAMIVSLFPIYHVLLLLRNEMLHNNGTTDWIQLVNESCWEMARLIVTTLPTLARQRKLPSWKHLGNMFSLLNP